MRKHAVLVLLLSLLLILPVSAQDNRTVVWERWDVVLDNIDAVANRFDVTEIYDVEFSGTFRFGSRVLEMNNLDVVENIQVSQNGQALSRDCSGGNNPGTFCASWQNREYTIVYNFFDPITDSSSNFEIKYTVVGALRIYDDGDQIYWSAIPDEHFGFTIRNSAVTVELPAGYAPREGADPYATYGAATNISLNGSTVTAVATDGVSGNEELEIRVQFPHNPDAQPPEWQASFDSSRAFEENVKPLLRIGAFVVSLLILLGGSLFMYIKWYQKGRDPKIGPVPDYLSEPPTEGLSPALVGGLVDEQVDVRDVISIVVDLAQRGYMVIEETRESAVFGLSQKSEFAFKRTDKPLDDLRKFERSVIDGIFGGKREASLDDLQNKFYVTIAKVKREVYAELGKSGFFNGNPEKVRTSWMGSGGCLFAIGFVLLIGSAMFELLENDASWLVLPGAFVILGLVVMAFGRAMPAKTREGATESAKWQAFGKYLRNLDRYAEPEQEAAHFADYLPYAVAFGVENSWVSRFSRVQSAQVPRWYYPTYLGGPWGQGYTPGTSLSADRRGSGLPGEIARAGDGGLSLDSMSAGMATGLAGMSDGLTTMLNSAAKTMTSQPSSSGSGGGSWSGGGSSGGGSSGGGSSGFG
jgi:uncharacterized membrane protein